MANQHFSRALLRQLVNDILTLGGSQEPCVGRLVAQLRTKLPSQRLNDAELIHLIWEAQERCAHRLSRAA